MPAIPAPDFGDDQCDACHGYGVLASAIHDVEIDCPKCWGYGHLLGAAGDTAMERFDCAQCEHEFHRRPTFDREELHWLPNSMRGQARRFCSIQCLDAFAERHAMRGAA